MHYVDTSVLVAYYCPEPLSEKAEAFLLGHGQPIISALTEVELCSAVARKVRERVMGKVEATKITGKFISHLEKYLTLQSASKTQGRSIMLWPADQ